MTDKTLTIEITEEERALICFALHSHRIDFELKGYKFEGLNRYNKELEKIDTLIKKLSL